MAEPRFRGLDETNPIEMFPGVVRRTLVSGDRQTLVRIDLTHDAEVPEHTHPHEQAGTVILGRILLRIGDEVQELDEGASYLIPSDAPHFVHALQPTTLVEVFAPAREEFAAD
jgi:quercetin dioxygenase-like cupin family protein